MIASSTDFFSVRSLPRGDLIAHSRDLPQKRDLHQTVREDPFVLLAPSSVLAPSSDALCS